MKKGIKKCSGCQTEKSVKEFYKNKRMNDGRREIDKTFILNEPL